ncbi:Mov34/MPN/PAD-1 family protein [Marinimicrobium sp. ARAG 43.8]|uniref:Mov34/MPN/PAD-1 family protein n=1 Tax=Marinimicrobium sp. ARAG 43.8 TaxID=3418719 RepID=UPI003CF804E8
MTGFAWTWKWPKLDCELLVSKSVAKVLNQYRQKRFNLERGGQLFADLGNSNGLVLSDATPPHYNDQAGKSWINLDPERCKQEILDANERGLRLVGYWHTHPQSVPEVSHADIESFRRFSENNSQQLPSPIAVIVGTSNKSNGIRAWSFRQGSYIEGVWSEYLGS